MTCKLSGVFLNQNQQLHDTYEHGTLVKYFATLKTIYNSEDLTLKTVMVISAQRSNFIHYLNLMI